MSQTLRLLRHYKKEITAKYNALFDMYTFVGDASDALLVHLFDNLWAHLRKAAAHLRTRPLAAPGLQQTIISIRRLPRRPSHYFDWLAHGHCAIR